MERISETDLILNEDGSLYHLNLFPDDISDLVILVGDPDRVARVSRFFDIIEVKKGKREFITHTGRIGKQRITVISTGIGTDNIDIVLNELDALVNIDLDTRLARSNFQSIDIIRIGTSGALQPDIPVDSLLISSAAFGLDTLMYFYEQTLTLAEEELLQQFCSIIPDGYQLNPYLASAGDKLIKQFGTMAPQGLTITAPGFYSPQGRQVRAKSSVPQLLLIVSDFQSSRGKITNLEMETAGIYGLASALGHNALSFNVILANRSTNKFSKNPGAIMDDCIQSILTKITETYG
ncbi:nucleoside phosphorylase [Mucilaginibacter sabulilitoris]|uniref:Uridine phosphorylase n=1 Tax=Mucilaginibacter sabulilitoris TaxID=1173583 RepID=A0ABZ0TDZ6_9SPHI|nr:nucleoside phosphorylase [Mucilaginibacter sabulilitoris]WPU91424.1 nucleoside phosphorylase [Mucilaginibacter sabulilitoris]